jgi:PhnB protein
MSVSPYLTFDGRCEEAFNFYEEVLGGKIEVMFPFEGSPAEGMVPPEWRNKIMHALLVVNGKFLMGSDAPPERYKPMQGFSVSFWVDDPLEAERAFEALADGGTITMPIAETFWAQRFGMLTDRFGTPWMVNCDKPE